MRPLLELASDGKEHSMRDARERLADKFKLTEGDLRVLLPSGRQPLFLNRVAWAKIYLQRAGVLDSTQRGYFRISERGREVLNSGPERITVHYLEKFPEFVEFRAAPRKKKEPSTAPKSEDDGQTPEELLEATHLRLRNSLSSELLVRVKRCSPQFFEQLVVELLLNMGYGGSREEAGEAIGASGDEGIDGVISEDRLGLDTIYLQAKKWEGTVGRPEIQKFVGALHGKRAKRGVFITTGSFSAEAAEYVKNIEPKVVLIDGRQLGQLMMDFNVGAASVISYDVKKIDSEYFEQD